MAKRRNFTDQFKARMALEALRGGRQDRAGGRSEAPAAPEPGQQSFGRQARTTSMYVDQKYDTLCLQSNE